MIYPMHEGRNILHHSKAYVERTHCSGFTKTLPQASVRHRSWRMGRRKIIEREAQREFRLKEREKKRVWGPSGTWLLGTSEMLTGKKMWQVEGRQSHHKALPPASSSGIVMSNMGAMNTWTSGLSGRASSRSCFGGSKRSTAMF